MLISSNNVVCLFNRTFTFFLVIKGFSNGFKEIFVLRTLLVSCHCPPFTLDFEIVVTLFFVPNKTDLSQIMYILLYLLSSQLICKTNGRSSYLV